MNREQGPGPDIGTALKDARRRIGMDVKEAEERTKIRAKYLRALEAEDWEVLPAPAYVRGFLRTYGALLGLDGEQLADQFRRSHEEPAGAASPASEAVLQERRRGGGSRPPSRGPLIAAIAAGIVVLLVALSLLGGGGDDGKPVADPGKGSGSGAGKNAQKGDKKSKNQKKSGNGSGKAEIVAINLSIKPLEPVRLCVVGGKDEALVDSQMLAAGVAEKFTDHKNYRVDLQSGGSVKVDTGKDAQKLKSSQPASFDIDSNGIEEVEYAGPDCP